MKLALILGLLAFGVVFSMGVVWQLAAVVGLTVAYVARPQAAARPGIVVYQEEQERRRWW